MEQEGDVGRTRRIVFLIAGIVLFFAALVWPTPEGLSVEGKRAGAMVLLMACWWIGESIPIGITALVPLVAMPLMGTVSAKDSSLPYADHNIFLFMGGFFIAMAMQKWNLHKRIALTIVGWVGFKPRRIVLGFMIATAFISMWMSNTATTLMVIPIVVALLKHFENEEGGPELIKSLGPALALGVAYSASVGGMGTLVGTPPNIVFAKAAQQIANYNVSFLGWMAAAMPFVIVFIPIMWIFLTRIIHKVPAEGGAGKEIVKKEIANLGPMSSEEKIVLAVFTITAILWITREGIKGGGVDIPGWASLFKKPEFITDATVAMTMSMIMFFIPAGPNGEDRLLDIEWAMKIPWDVILLLGGGFSLANAVSVTGLGAWVGQAFEPLSHIHYFPMILIVCLIITFVNEVMSNTACAVLFLPILGAAAIKAGIPPMMIMIPAALAASNGYMLPSGTPPNAIAFATKAVTLPQMTKAGFIFNCISVVIMAIIVTYFSLPLLGVGR